METQDKCENSADFFMDTKSICHELDYDTCHKKTYRGFEKLINPKENL